MNMQSTQTCAQSALAGYPEQPPVPTQLSSIAANVESINNELNMAVDRFARLADRLNGSQPQEVAKDTNSIRGTGGGLAALIETHLEGTGALLHRLRNVLERLETL